MKFFSRNRFFQKRKKNEVSSSKMNSLLNKIDFTEQNELTHVNTPHVCLVLLFFMLQKIDAMPFKNNKVRKSFSLEEATRLILFGSPMSSEENGRSDFRSVVDENLARDFGEENGRKDLGGVVDEKLARGFGEENERSDFGGVVDENLVRGFGGVVNGDLAEGFGEENGRSDFGGIVDENLARGFGKEILCGGLESIVESYF